MELQAALHPVLTLALQPVKLVLGPMHPGALWRME